MAITTERNASSVFDRLGKVPHPTKIKTCKFWLQGRCNRIPCTFLNRTIITAPVRKTKQLLLAPKTMQQLMSNQLIKPSNNNVDTASKPSRKKMIWRNNNNNNNNPKNQQQEPDSRKMMTSSSGDSGVSGVKSATSDLIEQMKEEIGGSSAENTQPSHRTYGSRQS